MPLQELWCNCSWRAVFSDIQPMAAGVKPCGYYGLCFYLFDIEILHGGYFIFKFYKGQGPVPQIGETKILNRVLKENREKRIYTVFTSTGNIFFDKAAYLGAGVLKKPDALNGPGIKSSKPVFMLICLRFDTIKYFSYFLRQYGVNYIGNENGYLFFTYYIKPVANSYK